MGILHLISQDSFIMTSKPLIRAFGLIEANLIGLFASIHNYNETITPDFDGWFFATREKIEKELGLGIKTSSKYLQKLEDEEILFTKKKGVPCKKYYKFNDEKLINYLMGKNYPTSKVQITQQVENVLPDKSDRNYPTSEEDITKLVGQKSNNNNKNTVIRKEAIRKDSYSSSNPPPRSFFEELWKKKNFKSSLDLFLDNRELAGWKNGKQQIADFEKDSQRWENYHREKYPHLHDCKKDLQPACKKNLQLEQEIEKRRKEAQNSKKGENLLEAIKKEFKGDEWDKWLSKLEVYDIIDDQLILIAPDKFTRDWIIREFIEKDDRLSQISKNEDIKVKIETK